MIDGELQLMIEYFSGGDLSSYLKSSETYITTEDAKLALQQICNALFYCH